MARARRKEDHDEILRATPDRQTALGAGRQHGGTQAAADDGDVRAGALDILSAPSQQLLASEPYRATARGNRRAAAVRRALDWAEVAAMLGDFREAVSWLNLVETIGGTVPGSLVDQRQLWLKRA
jgi:hypothetical protein